VKCELHNEELLTKLKAHERDILVEKREAEKVRCFFISAGLLRLSQSKFNKLGILSVF
jgi:hypothetical protein